MPPWHDDEVKRRRLVFLAVGVILIGGACLLGTVVGRAPAFKYLLQSDNLGFNGPQPHVERLHRDWVDKHRRASVEVLLLVGAGLIVVGLGSMRRNPSGTSV